MSKPRLMSPQERVRLAQECRKAANRPDLPQSKKQNLRRHAHNLMKANEWEAKRREKTKS